MKSITVNCKFKALQLIEDDLSNSNTNWMYDNGVKTVRCCHSKTHLLFNVLEKDCCYHEIMIGDLLVSYSFLNVVSCFAKIWKCYFIAGPFKINGVPLRRVNQSYVIATSTKVDISGVNVEKFDDKYFAKEVEKKKKKGQGEFFEAEKEDKKKLPDDKKEDQKSVDASLIKSIEVVPDLKAYLAARFSLKSGMKPHELVF
ncbi:60S ribosomal protein L6-1-like [Herrania umbratica]|uniref:60S ribosomal protein L6 n=1 Tax=Herrania umbratica TaxID=108875 RepID=A0A6J1A595_9ROSI|nr:60S ribosomal protein L6-1-like [Herrania umbratica]